MFFYLFFFFFNDTATTEIYTLSLHDALPIFIPFDRRRTNRHGVRRLGRLPQRECGRPVQSLDGWRRDVERLNGREQRDRKSTRLNSSHGYISYAVFCLKKKNKYNVSTISKAS